MTGKQRLEVYGPCRCMSVGPRRRGGRGFEAVGGGGGVALSARLQKKEQI